MVNHFSFIITMFSLLTLGYAWADESLEQIESGADLAKSQCSRCHVVDDTNLYAGISSTPSFMFLVNELEDWEDRFLSFHTRLPHPSIVRFEGDESDPTISELHVPVILKFSDIDSLVAYARSLKKQ